MGTRVKIMDIDVDLLTQETCLKELSGYLENDSLNVVHMISLDYMDAYDKNELVQTILKQADLVLPGEKAILTAHHVDVLETGGMVVDYHSLQEILSRMDLEKKSFYLVLRDEKEAKVLYQYLIRRFSKEQVLGVYAADGEVTEEALVNDINTKLPDVVLLSMSSTDQEEWLEHNKSKINAKLCLVAGSILPLIMRENVHVPNWIKSIGLGGLYRWLVRIPYSHSMRRRIFNRKMDDYNTKKKFRRQRVE